MKQKPSQTVITRVPRAKPTNNWARTAAAAAPATVPASTKQSGAWAVPSQHSTPRTDVWDHPTLAQSNTQVKQQNAATKVRLSV